MISEPLLTAVMEKWVTTMASTQPKLLRLETVTNGRLLAQAVATLGRLLPLQLLPVPGSHLHATTALAKMPSGHWRREERTYEVARHTG